MQQLELTDKHKKQLVKMCKKLFPNYKDFGITFEDNFIFFSNPTEYENTIYIAWFEFCLLYIAPKLVELIEITIDSDINEEDPIIYKNDWAELCDTQSLVSNLFFFMEQDKVHPVDYLYKQFKLLK